MTEPQPDSYATILKSSFLVGGAQFVRILISLVRVKFTAIILGPEGIGLIGLLSSSTKMLATLSEMGIRTSALRDVSLSHGEEDTEKLAITAGVLKRICWITGISGWLLTIAFSKQLSVWTFGTTDYTTSIAILGMTILIGQLTVSQLVLLQGTRRIKALAWQSILSALTGAIASIVLYVIWDRSGIVPALLATAFAGLFFSWWYSRRVSIDVVAIDLKQTTKTGLKIVRLGLVFMYSALLAAFVAWATQAYLANHIGVAATGIYNCGWSLSAQFAIFILGAMKVDFFPRLSAVSTDRTMMTKLVNEQTEVGILLALPGLVATLVFAPFIVKLLYSDAFLSAADLLPWFVMGAFFRVVHWPIGMIQVALGAGKSFAITQTIGHAIHLVLIIVLTNRFGVIGCAFAFMITHLLILALVNLTVIYMIQFRWSASVRRLLLASTSTVIVAYAIVEFLPADLVMPAGGLLTAVCAYLCLRGLLARVGPNHRVSRLLKRISFLDDKSGQ